MRSKPGSSRVIRSTLQPGRGQSSFMLRPMGFGSPPRKRQCPPQPRKVRESHASGEGSYSQALSEHASRPTRSSASPRPRRNATSASGSLATRASLTIRPSSSTTQMAVSSSDTSSPAKCFTAAPPRGSWPMHPDHAPPSWAEQPPPGREPQSLQLFESAYRAGARIGIGLSSASKPERMPTTARRAAETSSRPARSLARPPRWTASRSSSRPPSGGRARRSPSRPGHGRRRGGACRARSTTRGSAQRRTRRRKGCQSAPRVAAPRPVTAGRLEGYGIGRDSVRTDKDGRMTLDGSPYARPPHGPDVALVLGGGHALGAYQAGAYESMRACDLRPGRIVGSSTGAITAAILAGNPPERRVERLRHYWDEAAQADAWAFAPPRTGPSRALYNAAHVTLALGLGRPGIFRPRYADAGRRGGVALPTHAPLRGTLERLVDFDLLNRAGPRLSVGCVDVESGEEVWFDSAEEPIRPEHVLASAALMPHLPPVAIGDRLLCDPGYVNNLPVNRALAEPPERDLLCLAVDLFCLRGRRPASLGAAAGRMEDVLFASHAGRHVAALRREYGLRARLESGGPPGRGVHLPHPAPGAEGRGGM